MALSLKRVELTNIRSHGHIVFEPADQGLTSISGPNGAGKSTLVDSVAWILYGTKPQGVSKVIAIVKEGTELGKDRCFASLDLEIDGRLIRIVRKFVNKGGSVECEVLESTADVDEAGEPTTVWKNVAGPAVSHAELYIRKLLRMDEKGFLAAILIQQKQVDQLISATPRERAAVIEKLTGIASVTAAVTESRQEYNNLRKMASFSTVNENELEEFKKEKAQLETELHSKTALYNRLVSEEKELKKRGAELKEEVERETEKFDAASEAKDRLTGLKASVEAKEKELVRVVADKDAKKEKLSTLSSGGSLSDIETKLAKLRSTVSKLNDAIASRRSRLETVEATLTAHEELIGKSKIKELEPAREGLEAQLKKIAAAEAKGEQLKKERAAILGKQDSLATAIEVIRDGHGECPTCLQKVADVKAAVDSLTAESEELSGRLATLASNEEKVKAALTTAEDARSKFELLVEALASTTDLQVTRDTLTSELSEQAGAKKAAEGEVAAMERVYSEVKSQEDLKNDYSRLLSTAQAISTEIETMKNEMAEIQATDFGTLTNAALNKLRKKLEDARTEYMNIASSLTEEKGDIKLLREKVKHLEEKIGQQEIAIKKHQELLKSVEVAANSTQLLEEFRSNRIEHSVPLIEAYASDLLSRFTEGKFTRLKIDGKFNATVMLADGRERAIGLLSGGELSAASMSLRLAISMLLNGGSSQSLIIMDEVLVSQDASRAELILTTVKDVCRGQVILIAHNDSINDVADKLFQLV